MAQSHLAQVASKHLANLRNDQHPGRQVDITWLSTDNEQSYHTKGERREYQAGVYPVHPCVYDGSPEPVLSTEMLTDALQVLQ